MDAYQGRARGTALPSAQSLDYLIPGLAAEAGEVAGVYAKAVRDNDGFLSDSDKGINYADKIRKELGDVLWFVAMIAHELDTNLGDIAQMNLDKLAARKERGTLQGSGDDR